MVNAKPVIQEWTCQGCWTTHDTETEAEWCCSGKLGCGKSLLDTPSYCLCGDATYTDDHGAEKIGYCDECKAKLSDKEEKKTK